MEQILKQVFHDRQTNRLSNVQQNCLANSNCLHTAGGSFAELSSDIKSFLGVKKLSTSPQLRAKIEKMFSKQI